MPQIVNDRYGPTSPFLIGEPDGDLRLAVTTARIAGRTAGFELWVTGDGVDAAVEAGFLTIASDDFPRPLWPGEEFDDDLGAQVPGLTQDAVPELTQDEAVAVVSLVEPEATQEPNVEPPSAPEPVAPVKAKPAAKAKV